MARSGLVGHELETLMAETLEFCEKAVLPEDWYCEDENHVHVESYQQLVDTSDLEALRNKIDEIIDTFLNS